MNLTHKDVTDIIEFIDKAEHLEDIELSLGDFRLSVHRGGGVIEAAPRVRNAPALPAAPVKSVAPAVAVAAPAVAASEVLQEGEIALRSPMLGSFYRSPSPGAPAFVEVGQKVKAGDTVGVIEVMKLFNTLSASASGTVVRIAVENGGLVEFNQIVMVIDTRKV